MIKVLKKMAVYLMVVITIVTCGTIETEASSVDILNRNDTFDFAIYNNILEDMGLSKKDLYIEKAKINISQEMSAIIPKEVNEYAKERFLPLIESVKDNLDAFNVVIDDNSDLQLGSPFVIYSVESIGTQEPIYYYPVLNDNKIILTLYVIDCGGEYSAGINSDYATQLDTLQYQKDDDYIFYEEENCIYAENYKSQKMLYEFSMPKEIVYEHEDMNRRVFEDLSIENKVVAILNSYSNGNEIGIRDNENLLEFANGFSTKTANIVKLNTNNCLVPQGNNGNCWAASVATTLRYINFSKYRSLTATDVCDAMDIGYNTGASIKTKQAALEKYGCTYSNLQYSQCSFSSVKTNILDQWPVLVSAFDSNSSGHAVTIVGYSTYGSIDQITFYNSGTDTCTSVEYKSAGTTFSYNNKKWTWKYTLSYE